jgi:hypothetical protein
MSTGVLRRVVDVIEDCEFMADNRETLTGAAARLGYASRDSLERVLHRAGRYDLVTRLKAPETDALIAGYHAERRARRIA